MREIYKTTYYDEKRNKGKEKKKGLRNCLGGKGGARNEIMEGRDRVRRGKSITPRGRLGRVESRLKQKTKGNDWGGLRSALRDGEKGKLR